MGANIPPYICGPMQSSSRFRLGFACAWDADRRRTWSHTPLSLFEALQRQSSVDVVDVPIHVSAVHTALARLMYMRMIDGRIVSGWRYSALSAAAHERALLRGVQAARPLNAVLSIGELGIPSAPTFIYQDHCLSHALHDMRERNIVLPSFESYPASMLQRRVERERRSYRAAAGVITMSAWNASFLVEHGIVPAERVHVVPPGIHIPVPPPSTDRQQPRDPNAERRVLFIGRDWYRKAGDVVLRAIRSLQGTTPFPITIVVAGPRSWPEEGSVPSWVTFLGDASHAQLREELRRADVFAMPSRFEAYGIAPLEALAAGVPVLGRRDFAMPEYIRHADNGMLIANDDADACAHALLTMLTDDAMRARVALQAPDAVAKYSWDRAAAQIVRIVGSAAT